MCTLYFNWKKKNNKYIENSRPYHESIDRIHLSSVHTFDKTTFIWYWRRIIDSINNVLFPSFPSREYYLSTEHIITNILLPVHISTR